MPLPTLNSKADRPVPAPGRSRPGLHFPPRPIRYTQAARRAGWIAADQAASSLTNVALSVVVARATSVEEFGVFSLVYATYLFALELARALILEPLVIAFSGQQEQIPLAGRRALGATVVLGCLASFLLILTSVIALGGATRYALLVLAACLPGLLLQDSCRAVLLAERRPSQAFLNDSAWGISLLASLLLFRDDLHHSVAAMVILWGATGWAAAILGLMQVSMIPAVAQAWHWIRQTRDRGAYFLMDFLVDSASGQLAIYVVGIVAGLKAVAALNAARVLMGPIGVLTLTTTMLITSEGQRLSRRPRNMMFLVGLGGTLLFLTAGAWSLILHYIPNSFGEHFLGPSFQAAKTVVVPIGVYWGCRGLMTAARIAMRVIRPGMGAVAIQLALAPVTLLGVAIGAAVLAARGAAWGLVAVAGPGAIAWWMAYSGAVRHIATNRTPSRPKDMK